MSSSTWPSSGGGAVDFTNGFIASTRTITANDSILDSDFTILADATGGPISITDPGSAVGRIVNIKKIDSSTNTVTIAGQVDGVTPFVLSDANENYQLHKSAVEWKVI